MHDCLLLFVYLGFTEDFGHWRNEENLIQKCDPIPAENTQKIWPGNHLSTSFSSHKISIRMTPLQRYRNRQLAARKETCHSFFSYFSWLLLTASLISIVVYGSQDSLKHRCECIQYHGVNKFLLERYVGLSTESPSPCRPWEWKELKYTWDNLFFRLQNSRFFLSLLIKSLLARREAPKAWILFLREPHTLQTFCSKTARYQ